MEKNLKVKNIERNSLIELLRFFFAFVVLKGHGFFPYQGEWIGTASVPVDCFFIITGWFLIKMIKKATDLVGGAGSWRSFWWWFKNRMKSLFIPVLLICFPLTLATMFLDPSSNGFGVLWYLAEIVVSMVIYYFIFYFTVYKKQNKKLFNIILVCIFLVSTSIRFVDSSIWHLPFKPIYRGISPITLGILVAKIPKFDGKKWLKILFFGLFSLVEIFNCCYPPAWINPNIKDVINFVFMPWVLYFGLQINFIFKPFNFLGKISGPIYYYQSIDFFVLYLGIKCEVSFFTNVWTLFVLVLLLSIGEEIISYLAKRNKQKTEQAEKISEWFEKKPKQKWWLYSFSIVLLLSMIALGIVSLVYINMKLPGWEMFQWVDEEGQLTFFTKTYELIFLVGIVPWFCSINLELLLKGRKKYPSFMFDTIINKKVNYAKNS